MTSQLVHTAMCDRCGTLRDYKGTRMCPSLLCKTCNRRTWHGIIGCDEHREELLARQRQANSHLLARYARLREIFEGMGFAFHSRREAVYAFELTTFRGQLRIYFHPRLTLESKVEGMEVMLSTYLDPVKPLGWVWPAEKTGRDHQQHLEESYLIPENRFQMIPDEACMERM